MKVSIDVCSALCASSSFFDVWIPDISDRF